MKDLTKTNKTILVLAVILVLVLGGVLFWKKMMKGDNYYAVYLMTGDIYFGKLSRFPHFGLRNVYTLQVNPQSPESPINIQKFSNVFWGPEDYMKLNRDQVVWITRLNSAGQLAELIKANPNLVPPSPSAP